MSALSPSYTLFRDPPPPVTTPPVAGYVCHFDPSDPSTLSFSGGQVSQMNDKSGNGNHATPTVSVPLSPILPTNRRGLLFSATGRYNFALSASDISQSGFIVLYPLSNTVNIPVIGCSAAGGRMLRISTVPDWRMTRQNVAEMGIQVLPLVYGAPTVYGYVLDATNCKLYTNLATETDAHGQTLTASLTSTLGLSAGTGADSVSARAILGEAVFYDTTLSAGDADDVVEYLMEKWGIA